MNFGVYLREKRIERNLTLRKFATLIDKTPSTISGIENGDKTAPSDEVLKSICTVLQLNSEEGKLLYDLALETKTNNTIPADITINKSNTVRIALRVAKNLDATDEEWEDFMRRLQEKMDAGGCNYERV
ncbi:helix-turn-helix domain-containing protein [Chakrabartyella piscis]|uniref:helix-turn-helix domain-containing protein n=1 Tax=Chakrabartyella piscis TaxID=2918914 RepID=UPI002958A9CF|nr:helix-turn-helix domain-containing protein [Chakrabartyella piscis]